MVTDKCNGKFLACLFVHGANGQSDRKCINKLNDVHLSGNDQHPKSAEVAMNHMSHFMHKNHSDELGVQLIQKKTTKCWSCNEEGHKENKCLKQEKSKEQPKSKHKEAKVHWCKQLGK